MNKIELTGMLTDTPPENIILKNPDRKTFIRVKRSSGKEDVIPVEGDVIKPYTGKRISATGSLESRDFGDKDSGHALDIYVYIKKCRDAAEDEPDTNRLSLSGTVSGVPIYRTTPKGKEISDIRIKTKDARGRTNWIPCIIWNEGAKKAASLKPDMEVSVKGRLESREYKKDGEDKPRMAYEVSTGRVTKNSI